MCVRDVCMSVSEYLCIPTKRIDKDSIMQILARTRWFQHSIQRWNFFSFLMVFARTYGAFRFVVIIVQYIAKKDLCVCVSVCVWASQNASTNTWYNLVACCSAYKNIRMDTVQWFCGIKMLTLLLYVDHVFLLSINKWVAVVPCLFVAAFETSLLGPLFFCHRCVEISESPYTHNPSSSLASLSYCLPPSLHHHLPLTLFSSADRSFVRSFCWAFFSSFPFFTFIWARSAFDARVQWTQSNENTMSKRLSHVRAPLLAESRIEVVVKTTREE